MQEECRVFVSLAASALAEQGHHVLLLVEAVVPGGEGLQALLDLPDLVPQPRCIECRITQIRHRRNYLKIIGLHSRLQNICSLGT